MADVKIGAYICKDCGLGERLDTKSLMQVATHDAKAHVVREHDFLCNADGVQMIKNDIANEGVNRVAICACSRRSKTDALNSGYDGVVLMGCQKGENYQCHFVKGSEIAHVRMSKVDDTLKTLNLEIERVATYEIAITDIERAPKLINDMAEVVKKIGMSPFKF